MTFSNNQWVSVHKHQTLWKSCDNKEHWRCCT